MDGFLEFMSSPWGIAIFTVVAIAVVVLFLAVNYRYFTKVFLDYLFGAVFLIIVSPALGVCAAILRSKVGRAFEKVWIVGRGGKPVQVRVFTSYSRADGTECYISRSCLHYFPLLLDIFTGKLSLVGPSPLALKDGALIDEEFEPRFSVRPGIFTAASLSFASRPDYESMFRADCDYAAKRSLFSDVRAVVSSFLRAVRGEKSGFLSFDMQGYADELLKNGEITEEQYKQAEQIALEEAEAARRAPMRVG